MSPPTINNDLHGEFRNLLQLLYVVTTINRNRPTLLEADSGHRRVSRRGVMDAVASILVQEHEIVAVTSTSPTNIHGIVNDGRDKATPAETDDQRCLDGGKGGSEGGSAASEWRQVENKGGNWRNDGVQTDSDDFDRVRVNSDGDEYVIEAVLYNKSLNLTALPNPDRRRDKHVPPGPAIISPFYAGTYIKKNHFFSDVSISMDRHMYC